MLTNDEVRAQIQKYYKYEFKNNFSLIPSININNILADLKKHSIFPFINSEWKLSRTDKNNRLFYIFLEQFAMNIIEKNQVSIQTVIFLLSILDFYSDTLSEESLFIPKLFIVETDNYTFAELHICVYNKKIFLVNLNDPTDDLLYLKYNFVEDCDGEDNLEIIIKPTNRLSDMKCRSLDLFKIYKVNKQKINGIINENKMFVNYDYPEIYFMAYCMMLYRMLGTERYKFPLFVASNSYFESNGFVDRLDGIEDGERNFTFQEHNLVSLNSFNKEITKDCKHSLS